MGLKALIKLRGFQGLYWNWWVPMLEWKLVGFKALIETGGVRSIKLFMSRTRLTVVGIVPTSTGLNLMMKPCREHSGLLIVLKKSWNVSLYCCWQGCEKSFFYWILVQMARLTGRAKNFVLDIKSIRTPWTAEVLSNLSSKLKIMSFYKL